MISILAPDGIGEIRPETDLPSVLHAALQGIGGLRPGDIVVITSKIISKHEGRQVPAGERLRVIEDQTVRTVARRRTMAIVETPHGLVQAAAGVDNSNVDSDTVLLLPEDPDATAELLRRQLTELSGVALGVIISDTAGRAWRLGQTDHAIGAAGVRVIESYDGRVDDYGNELHVTAVAIADELAGAADLAKRKLAGRPVAVIRGLPEFVLPVGPERARSADPRGPAARDLQRPGSDDLFAMGVRESVLHALLAALGRAELYEALVRLEDPAQLRDAVLGGLTLDAGQRELVDRLLEPLALPSAG